MLLLRDNSDILRKDLVMMSFSLSHIHSFPGSLFPPHNLAIHNGPAARIPDPHCNYIYYCRIYKTNAAPSVPCVDSLVNRKCKSCSKVRVRDRDEMKVLSTCTNVRVRVFAGCYHVRVQNKTMGPKS